MTQRNNDKVNRKALLRKFMMEEHPMKDKANPEDLLNMLKARTGLSCSDSLIQKAKQMVRQSLGLPGRNRGRPPEDKSVLKYIPAPVKPQAKVALKPAPQSAISMTSLFRVRELVAELGLDTLIAVAETYRTVSAKMAA